MRVLLITLFASAFLFASDPVFAHNNWPWNNNYYSGHYSHLAFSVTPNSHNFGEVKVGEGVTRSFKVTNFSNSPISFVPYFTGVRAPFSLDFGTCRYYPYGLAKKQSCEFSIRFKPQVKGNFSERMTIFQVGHYYQFWYPWTIPTVSIRVKGQGVNPTSQQPANLVASPGFNDFGEVVVGRNSSFNFTLTNIGEMPASNISVSGLTGSFSSGTCSQPIAPQGTCTLAVNFAPNQSGPFNQNFSVNYNTGNNSNASLQAGVSGHGINPAALVSQVSYDFGRVVVGGSNSVTLSFINTGDAPATNVSVSGLTGALSATNCPSSTIQPQGSCDITVTFSPIQAGGESQTLSIAHHNGATAAVAQVPITGQCLAPAQLTSLANYDFGRALVGATSTLSFSFVNTGDVPATNVSFGGLSGPLSVSSCGATLVPHTPCTVTVTLTPTQAGNIAQSLALSYHNGLSGVSTSYPVVGVALNPANLAFQNAHDFGNVVIGNTATHTVLLANTGDVEATSVNLSGLSGALSSTTCGPSIAPFTSCSITLSFAPQDSDPESQSLIVGYHDGLAVVFGQIALTGSGVNPARLSLATSSHDFDVVIIGQSATFTFIATNSGDVAATNVGVADLASPFSIVSTTCDANVAPGDSCDIQTTFTPTVAGFIGPIRLALSYDNGLEDVTTEGWVSGSGRIPIPTVLDQSFGAPDSTTLPNTVNGVIVRSLEPGNWSFQVNENPSQGTVVVNASTGAFTYTPSRPYALVQDSFYVSVTDGTLTSSWARISVEVQSFCTASYNAQTIVSQSCGSAASPCAVCTLSQFNEIERNQLLTRNYALMADIDMNAAGNVGQPIYSVGTGASFRGVFDGRNHAIINVRQPVQRTTTFNIALFARIDFATIRNLRIENIAITGHSPVAGIVSSAYDSTIDHCSVSGSVSGVFRTGGLVGYAERSTITRSRNLASIFGHNTSGGIIGQMDGYTLSESYSSGLVQGDFRVGGLIGWSQGGRTTVQDSYSSSEVNLLPNGSAAGGFAGIAAGHTVRNVLARGPITAQGSFSLVGGVVHAFENSSVLSAFWYPQPASLATVPQNNWITSTGSTTALSSSALLDQRTFTDVGWDFTTRWRMTSQGPGLIAPDVW